ncbi:hypothetical protein ACVGVM_13780 [Pseudonocardia bannensis]|uniref:Uncharacterized protein n=1 Tax=Pseudonocardia bannensis TaxID=630973 RepID=A0A848DN07_9PSEU|nr:hypothetical protein [Pseudonocardia bannensis]NMH94078.1 hypothetical protein [Pseudonocardia bannensis]
MSRIDESSSRPAGERRRLADDPQGHDAIGHGDPRDAGTGHGRLRDEPGGAASGERLTLDDRLAAAGSGETGTGHRGTAVADDRAAGGRGHDDPGSGDGAWASDDRGFGDRADASGDPGHRAGTVDDRADDRAVDRADDRAPRDRAFDGRAADPERGRAPADTADARAPGDLTGDEGSAGATRPEQQVGRRDDNLATLIPHDRSASHRARWEALKADFVDDPRSAVRGADQLVGQVLDEIEDLFRRRRSELERDWNDEQASTEDLRLALGRYRSFFDRLLSF